MDEIVHLFWIGYDAATRAAMPEGYELLDNSAHERDDWREYWPIRSFLLRAMESGTLDPRAWYGFFSPRFPAKTGLGPQDVRRFVRQAPAGTDVTTFSPQPDMGAFFLNVFEQEETFEPGFIGTSERFLAACGLSTRLGGLVMDSRQIVFSNYFVARPSFWRAWLDLTEKLFAICEGAESDLQRALVQDTNYPGGVPRKVFLMERIASLLLTIDPKWRVHAYDTFNCAWSSSRLNQFRLEAVLSDALKIAMREQGFPHYVDAYNQVRDRLR